jgi:hypothetical protein
MGVQKPKVSLPLRSSPHCTAGKLVYSGADGLSGSDYSMVDYNRAGVPLLEIVSGPDMRTGQEAAAYGAEIRRIMRFLDVSDGNMAVSRACIGSWSPHSAQPALLDIFKPAESWLWGELQGTRSALPRSPLAAGLAD